MIPAGYMAKRIVQRGDWLKAPHVVDIYSVNSCVNDNFEDDYVDFWKHNDFWFFNSAKLIQDMAEGHSIDLVGTQLFYYEVFEKEYAEGIWRALTPSKFALTVDVVAPRHRQLEGYDVVTVWVENDPAPEHSPLSCNSIAGDVVTNEHCLFDSFEAAHSAINCGKFEGGEKGTLRVIAVYSAEWPNSGPKLP